MLRVLARDTDVGRPLTLLREHALVLSVKHINILNILQAHEHLQSAWSRVVDFEDDSIILGGMRQGETHALRHGARRMKRVGLSHGNDTGKAHEAFHTRIAKTPPRWGPSRHHVSISGGG